MSRNDMVLLACGSRSMSSVGLPRRASAAARLMAVVVLPTPPFWLAMATIMKWRGVPGNRGHHNREQQPGCSPGTLHLVFAEVVGVQALQPLVQPVGVRLLGREIDRLRVIDDRVFHEDRRPGPERERDRVA